MGRFSTNHSYGHTIRKIDHDCYRIAWTTDRYYASSRLRHPTVTMRDTDTEGAKRFAKRWNVKMPE